MPAFERLKELRKALGWTQPQLASFLDVRTATVCFWETGKRLPHGINRDVYVALSIVYHHKGTLRHLRSRLADPERIRALANLFGAARRALNRRA